MSAAEVLLLGLAGFVASTIAGLLVGKFINRGMGR